MRGSAIRSVRSQCQSQCERPNFAPPLSQNPWTNLDGDSNISVCPPREWMCKIWRKSILPLRMCACVKRVFVWIFFVNISIYLSIYLSIYPVFRRGYRSHFWDDFNAQWLKRRVFATIRAFWGSRWYTLTFRGSKPPKTPIFGKWIGAFKPNTQNIKTSTLSKLLHRFQPNFAQW